MAAYLGRRFIGLIVALILVGIPLAWWMSRLWGVRGVWAAITLSEAVHGLGVLIWFCLGRWKRRRV